MKQIFLFTLSMIGLQINAQEDTLTVKEVFSFNIGDEFHINLNEYTYPNVSRQTIIDKWYNDTQDTLFYKVHEFGYKLLNLNLNDSVWEWIATYEFFDDTLEKYYTDLELKIYQYNGGTDFYSLGVNEIPETDANDCVLGYDDPIMGCSYTYTFEAGNSSCNPLIKENMVYKNTGEGGSGTTRVYQEGRGVTFNRMEAEGLTAEYRQEYFKSADGIECGTPDEFYGEGIVTFYEGVHEDSLAEEVSPVNEVASLNIYPNPTNDIIHLTFENLPCEVKIFNNTGEVMKRKYFDAEGSMNVSNFPSGMYFIQFNYANKKEQLTFLKQ